MHCKQGIHMKGINIIIRLYGLCMLLNHIVHDCGAQSVPPTRIMPLGDSITQGCCSTTEGGYRTKLYADLTAPASGFNVDFVGTLSDVNANPLLPDHDHEGHGGYHIETIRNNIAFWSKKVEDPDVILLHIGTNDFWAGNTLLQTQNSL